MSLSAGDAASIDGTNLWAVSYYYTPHANGDEDITIGKETFLLSQVNRNIELRAGQDLVLNDLTSVIDLSNLVCPDVSSHSAMMFRSDVIVFDMPVQNIVLYFTFQINFRKFCPFFIYE